MRYFRVSVHLCLLLVTFGSVQALAAPTEDDLSAIAQDVAPFVTATVFNAGDRSFSQPLGVTVGR